MLRIPTRATTSYAIKRPGGRRRTWAIQSVVGARRETLRLEAVDALNAAFLAGRLDFNEASKQMIAVREALYAQRDREVAIEQQFTSENAALLEQYWTAEYQDRDLVDPDSMRRDFERAIAACKQLSLRVAGRQDLQLQVNGHFVGKPNRQRRAVSRLNQLLRYAGRDFRLRMAKPVRAPVLHLTWDELTQVLPHLPDDRWRLLARVAWVTGARLGELFGLQAHCVQTSHVVIATQIDDGGVRRETKTRTERRTTILRGTQGRIWAAGWAGREWETDYRPPSETGGAPTLRHVRHSTIFRAACRRAFPDRSDKWCRFHDLRHSYAIELLNCGVPIEHVALNLGNSVAVCERHYVGFIQKDAGLEMVARLVAEARGWK